MIAVAVIPAAAAYLIPGLIVAAAALAAAKCQITARGQSLNPI